MQQSIKIFMAAPAIDEKKVGGGCRPRNAAGGATPHWGYMPLTALMMILAPLKAT